MNFQQVLLFLISSAAAQRVQHQTVATGTVASNVASYQQAQYDNAQQRHQSVSSYVAVNGYSAPPTDVRNSVISSNLASKSEVVSQVRQNAKEFKSTQTLNLTASVSQVVDSVTGTVASKVISHKQAQFDQVQQRHESVSSYIAVNGTSAPPSSIINSVISSNLVIKSQKIGQFKQNVSSFVATQTTVSEDSTMAQTALSGSTVFYSVTGSVANAAISHKKARIENIQQRHESISSYIAVNGTTAPPPSVVSSIISSDLVNASQELNQFKQNASAFMATQTLNLSATISQIAASISEYNNNSTSATASSAIDSSDATATEAPISESTSSPAPAPAPAPTSESSPAPVVPAAESTSVPAPESTSVPAPESTSVPVPESTSVPVPESTPAPAENVSTSTLINNISSYKQIRLDNAQQRRDNISSYVAVNGYSTVPTEVRNSAISSIVSAKSQVMNQIQQKVSNFAATQTQFASSTVSQILSSIANTATATTTATPKKKVGFFEKLKFKKKQKKATKVSALAATGTGTITEAPSPTATSVKNGFKNFFKKLQLKIQRSPTASSVSTIATTSTIMTDSAAPVATSSQ